MKCFSKCPEHTAGICVVMRRRAQGLRLFLFVSMVESTEKWFQIDSIVDNA